MSSFVCFRAESLTSTIELMHAGMGIEASQNYKSLQSIESMILLRDLLLEADSTKYASHLRRYVLFSLFTLLLNFDYLPDLPYLSCFASVMVKESHRSMTLLLLPIRKRTNVR